ncbi:MAG: Ig-like domain-containing protein [Gemmatimonadetes bacterium]|nr:Ig-like domain-containing protein [Gemmatimonadota bacterium]
MSSSGLVTAIAAGTATVTATSEGKSGSATITVLRPVGSVTLDRATATLVPAQTLQLAATPKADNGDSLTGRTLAWSSSTVAVATVNATGLVTAVTPGSSTITVTAEGKSATAAITVTSGGLVVANAPTTISNPDSSVRIEVPVGAAPPGLAITIVPTTTAPATALPARTWRMGPRLYEFGPNGTQFSAPVRVTL